MQRRPTFIIAPYSYVDYDEQDQESEECYSLNTNITDGRSKSSVEVASRLKCLVVEGHGQGLSKRADGL